MKKIKLTTKTINQTHKKMKQMNNKPEFIWGQRVEGVSINVLQVGPKRALGGWEPSRRGAGIKISQDGEEDKMLV